MPAVITDNFLTTIPWDRKLHFYPAYKTAIENAGFGTTIDEYDREDSWMKGRKNNNPAYNAGGPNSIKGIVKEMVLDVSKTKGTLQFDFFIPKNGTLRRLNVNGTDVSSSDPPNQAEYPGVTCYYGGWDSINKRRTLYTDITTAIGGWHGPKPTYTANMYTSNGSSPDNQITMSIIENAAYSVSKDSTWNHGMSNSIVNLLPYGYHFAPLLGVTADYPGVYGVSDNPNPLTRVFDYRYPVQFRALNHPEIRGVFVLQQNRAPAFFGYVRPATKPSWWDENNFPFVMIPQTPMFDLFAGFHGTNFPLANTPWYALHELVSPDLTGLNPVNGKIDMVSNPIIRYAPNSALLGRFSDEIVTLPPNTVAMFDRVVVSSGVEEYLVISSTKRTGETPALGIRIV